MAEHVPVPERSVNTVGNTPSALWSALAVMLVALAIMLHAVFPRYDYRIVDRQNSINVIVYDRWTGKFQRGIYGDTGDLTALKIWEPF
jgi:hypothetical protein